MTEYQTPAPTTNADGDWVRQFNVGEEAIVARENRQSAHDGNDIGRHHFSVGTVVTLRQYDPSDDSWEVEETGNPDGEETWIYQDCLAATNPVTDEDVEAAIASITKAASKPRWETHWLHPDARDPEFEGLSAFCDWILGLDEEPRTHTLSSRVRDEVDCPQCLSLMEKVGDVYDIAWADADHSARSYNNIYWGEHGRAEV